MGRPLVHDTQDLLDAAREIASAHGPAAVTMSATAAASGAPSGSLYHRFGNRSALLGEVWLRTSGRFEAGFLAALSSGSPLEGCVAAAGHVVAWSRAHDAEARLLLRGPADFGAAAWPVETRARFTAARRTLDAALRRAAAGLPGAVRGDVERVRFVTIDVPYAAVRRHLQAGAAGIPASAGGLVEEAARALLAGP